MRRSEGAAAARGAGLVEYRGALRRGFAKVDRVDPVEFSLMADAVDFRRIGVEAARPVARRGIISQLPSHSW